MKLPERKRRAWVPERKPQQGRTVDNSAIYNSWRWRKFRKDYLARNPLCVHCEKQGKIVPATVLDHKTQVIVGGAIFEEHNVQGLCEHHHAVKSGIERHAERGPRGSDL